MFSSSSVALLAFALSAAARVQIESRSISFFNAGIQACISAEDNVNGAHVIIHDCNTENVTHHDWEVSFFNKFEVVGEQIKVFGDKCIDVTGGVNADGTKLQIWTCDAANANQKWNSVQDETFQWTGTNKCIDLTEGKITDGNQLQIWTCDSNSANQGWSGGNVPDLTLSDNIIGGDFSVGGGGPYCIAAASDADGAEVALTACLNSDFHLTYPNGNITWVYPKAPLSGTISTFNNKCLDRFKVVSNQIQWVGTTKCLDLPGGSSTAKNPIQLWDCDTANANPNQKWFI